MKTSTTIQSQRVLEAPRQKVWQALTTREGWSGWFSDDVEGEFLPGHTLALDFGSYGKCFAIVDERTEGFVFAYRWHPGEDCPLDRYPEDEMTTVRFVLEDHPKGTLLTLTESGFERIPVDRQAKAMQLNTTGWSFELAELAVWVERDEPQFLANKEIVCERLFPCSQERLWELVGTSEGWSKWFVRGTGGPFVAGQLVELDMGDEARGEMLVVEVEALHKLVFRWHPGQRTGAAWDKFPAEEATETTFTLVPASGGTLLRVVEAGFERVPESRRPEVQELNSYGWPIVLGWLEGAL